MLSIITQTRQYAGAALFGLSLSVAAAPVTVIDVFRDPNCGCCTKWISYLQKNGYQVKDHLESDMHVFKQANGVPERLSSCHTGIIGGKFVEGHVPVEQISLLEQRDDLRGVSAPGMPTGSPGMERGGVGDSYQIIGVTRQGGDEVVAGYKAQ